MTSRTLALSLAAVSLAALSMAAVPALAQQATATYHAPKNGWGQPDLQGNWTTATITPVTRDPKYGTRNVLTKQEAFAIEQATRDQVARADAPTPPEATVKDLKNADCGPDGISGFNCGYNQGWKDPGTALIDINGEKRASIITSPANGQFPPVRQRRRGSAPRAPRGPHGRPRAPTTRKASALANAACSRLAPAPARRCCR